MLNALVHQASCELEGVDQKQVVAGECGEVELFTGCLAVAWLLSPSVCSKSSSCPMKLKVDTMLDFFLLLARETGSSFAPDRLQ